MEFVTGSLSLSTPYVLVLVTILILGLALVFHRNKLGRTMDDRRAKLRTLIKSGVISHIHYGAERYHDENCHVETYFSVDGPGWTLWVAAKTDYPPEIDHSKVPAEVCALFSKGFYDSLRLVKPIMNELKVSDTTLTIKLWERPVGHAGLWDFCVMRPASA